MRGSPRRSRAHSLFRSEYPLCHKDASARPPRAIVWPSAQAPIAWRLFSDLIGGIMFRVRRRHSGEAVYSTRHAQRKAASVRTSWI